MERRTGAARAGRLWPGRPGRRRGRAGAGAYGPVIAALRSYLRSEGGGLPIRGPLAQHLALLLPELGFTPAPGDRATLLEAIRSALAGIAAHRPAAVFLDDLHQADDATLELIAALARSIEHEPLLILGAYRSDEIPRAHPIRRMRSELRRARHLRELAVEPLDAEAGAALLERVLGAVAAPSLRRAVFDRTDGVPFFIEELGLALAASRRLQQGPLGLELLEGKDLPLPENVRDAVLLRADRLSDEARAAVLAASVAGQAFDPELVVTIAGLDEWPDELVRRGVVREVEPGRMAFRHALIQDAFYGEVPWTRRVGLHRAVAERLQADGAPPAVVAEQWARGREPDRARWSFLAAAEAFCAVHAYRDGARATSRALELWPEGQDEHGRLDVLERLARSAWPGRRVPPPGRRAGAPGQVGGGACCAGAGRCCLRHRWLPGGRGRGTARRGGAPALGSQLRSGAAAVADRQGRGALGGTGPVRPDDGAGPQPHRSRGRGLPAAGGLAGARWRLSRCRGDLPGGPQLLRHQRAPAHGPAVPGLPDGRREAGRRLGPRDRPVPAGHRLAGGDGARPGRRHGDAGLDPGRPRPDPTGQTIAVGVGLPGPAYRARCDGAAGRVGSRPGGAGGGNARVCG